MSHISILSENSWTCLPSLTQYMFEKYCTEVILPPRLTVSWFRILRHTHLLETMGITQLSGWHRRLAEEFTAVSSSSGVFELIHHLPSLLPRYVNSQSEHIDTMEKLLLIKVYSLHLFSNLLDFKYPTPPSLTHLSTSECPQHYAYCYVKLYKMSYTFKVRKNHYKAIFLHFLRMVYNC